MQERLQNINVLSSELLPTPEAIKRDLPLAQAAEEFVFRSRQTVRRILDRDDPRLFVVVGPCSIHDPVAAVVLCADVSNVEHVIVDGEFRKRDFKLLADVDRARTLVENARDFLVDAAAKAKASAE